jgi:cobyrinic acid a,c-diamide synthase
MKGVVLGGTASGVGKTVATLATVQALADAGYDPQPAKAGPDFIDPSHHEAIAGKPSRSLDPWLAGEEGTLRTYHHGEGDICVVEGMMGLYDGSKVSTASVAELLGLPVVLVVDAKAGMQSVGATALGFREYAAEAGYDIEVAGVLAQRTHGGRHADGIRAALPEGMRYLGRIPPTDDLEIPDRHLGLEMGRESALDAEALSAAAESVDAEAIAGIAREPPAATPETPAAGRTVAVASDAAFCFAYPTLRERFDGAIRPFSPLAGDPVPDADAVYLPGGYPELHGEALADSPTLDAIAERAAEGLPVFGECGGLMALAESLTTADGERHEMAGVLPARVEMQDRYQALDHVELTASRDTPVAAEGTRRRGHEFHYSNATVDGDARFAFDVERGEGIDGEHDGLTEYATVGTYCHVHPASGAFDGLFAAEPSDRARTDG